ALLAFCVVLLARRLFASGLVPALAGTAIVLDGSMFAQARIGMNDVYVGALIVAGWYFVVAAYRPRRSATTDILIAGVLLGLAAPHPAGSPWWSWPVVLKPVYWYFGSSSAGDNAYIYDAGNVVLFWGGLVAFGWCAVAAVRARSVALGFVLFAALVQYVAWIPITRVLFFYHFFTALPFYLLALAAALAFLWETGRARPGDDDRDEERERRVHERATHRRDDHPARRRRVEDDRHVVLAATRVCEIHERAGGAVQARLAHLRRDLLVGNVAREAVRA